MPRTLSLTEAASQTLLPLRLIQGKGSSSVMWEILEALERLRHDPFLVDLREEDGEEFIEAAGYAVSVAIGEDTVTVIALRKLDAN